MISSYLLNYYKNWTWMIIRNYWSTVTCVSNEYSWAINQSHQSSTPWLGGLILKSLECFELLFTWIKKLPAGVLNSWSIFKKVWINASSYLFYRKSSQISSSFTKFSLTNIAHSRPNSKNLPPCPSNTPNRLTLFSRFNSHIWESSMVVRHPYMDADV